jgi:hypothetical protein
MKNLILLIIPVTILLIINANNKTEFWKGKYDPEYCYLLNGLNLANQFGNIGLYEHPGTTVHVLSAIIIKTTFTFRKTKSDLATDVLLFPEYYLRAIAWTFTIINCLLIFFSGLMVFKLTNELSSGLLFQSVSFFSTSVYHAFYSVSPEPVLFGSVILFMLFFLWKYYFNKSFAVIKIRYSKSRKFDLDVYVLVSGFIMGICLATKINSIPLILLPMLFIRGLKNKVAFLVIAFISFILFTMPIARYYISFLVWIKDLFFHSGYYGRGNEEIINLNLVSGNFLTFIKYEPIILFTMVISLVFIIKQLIQKKYDVHLKILTGLFFIQILDLLLILKHFRLHYFIPIIPTIAVSIFIILKIAGLSKIQKTLLIVPFIAICFVINLNSKNYISTVYHSVNQTDCINIYAYSCNSPIYALAFGDGRAKNVNAPLLEKLYGKQYFYHLWTKQFSDWNHSISMEALTKLNKPIYFYADANYLKDLPTPFKLALISEGKYMITTK